MSQENVEVIRRWIESLGTPNPLWSSHADDARISNYTSENSPIDLTGARYEGPGAAQRWWRDVSGSFDRIRLELDREPIAVDQERVLAVHHFEGRSRTRRSKGPGPPGRACTGSGLGSSSIPSAR